jgi:hypothetical protein
MSKDSDTGLKFRHAGQSQFGGFETLGDFVLAASFVLTNATYTVDSMLKKTNV